MAAGGTGNDPGNTEPTSRSSESVRTEVSQQRDTGSAVPVPADRGTLDADAAFARYVKPELEVCFRVAMSITRSTVDAEDLVQDTLLRAYRAIDRFDGRHPRAWLLTIMRNAQINRTRRMRPGLLRDPDEAMRVASDDAETAQSGPEEHFMGGALDPQVEAAFTDLPDKFRAVVELVDIDGLTYAEAADVLDIPVGTVMSRLSRARRRMRDHLERHGFVGSRGVS